MRPPQPARTLLLFAGFLPAACGGLHACSGPNGAGGAAAELAPLRLTHRPPVARLDPQQLRSLSMECEKYPPHDSMRGRYDAAYCEEAIAAWSDSPLQMVVIPAAKAR